MTGLATPEPDYNFGSWEPEEVNQWKQWYENPVRLPRRPVQSIAPPAPTQADIGRIRMHLAPAAPKLAQWLIDTIKKRIAA